MANQKSPIYEFDSFRLDTGERLLLRDGQPVTLPSKAFDLLLVLVENSGRLVGKEELYQKVWADQVVEESNLTVQMSAIRKALGDQRGRQQYINTIIGRGYRFVGAVTGLVEDHEVVIETETLSRIVIQREEDVDANNLKPLKSRSGFATRADAKPLLPENGFTGGEYRIVTADASVKPVAETNSVRQRHLVVILSGALVAALVVAVAAVWLYQSRNRISQAPTSPVMTLRRFTTYGGVPNRVAISPDGKTLVYWQRINEKDSLWLGQIETNTSVVLNQQPDLRFDDLVFAPDGGSIYFNIGGANRARTMLGRMSVLGGAITELVPGVVGPVTFAPDGKQMAFLQRDEEAKQTSIIIANASDGQSQRTLISLKQPESFSSDGLSWSPDGKSIAFSSSNVTGQEEVRSVSVADASVNRIGNRDWGDVIKVVWVPDSSGVLVLAKENVGERMRQIWLVPNSVGEARRITSDLNLFLLNSLSVSSDGKLAVLQGHYNSEIWIAPHGDPKHALRVLQGVAPRYEGIDGLAWTPDGRLLYTAYVGDSEVIWSINSDGSDLTQLTPSKSNASDSNICVTADGHYVVFQSNRSGGIEIWRVNADGSGLKQLTSGGNNSLPSLSPDGHWVVYTAAREGNAILLRIPVDGGEPTRISDTPSTLSEVSPDGKYIACLLSSSRRLLVIPFAGGEPLRSFPLAEASLRGVPRMHWTPDGKAIIYRDATRGLLRQSLDEESPQMVKGFEELPLRNFAWSFDGKNLAYASGSATQEIILIENFR